MKEGIVHAMETINLEHPGVISESFTAVATGTAIDLSHSPTTMYVMQITDVGGVTTSYTVVVEGSIDGVTYTTLSTYTNATPGKDTLQWTTNKPARYIRMRCSAIVLNTATSISAKLMPTKY